MASNLLPYGDVSLQIVALIDSTTGRVKASTNAGQVLLLARPREELGRMKTGDTVTLVALHHAGVVGYR